MIERALAILGTRGDVFIRMLALLEAALHRPLHDSAAECAAVEEMAGSIEYLGVALKARLLRVRLLLEAGDVVSAVDLLPEHDARFRVGRVHARSDPAAPRREHAGRTRGELAHREAELARRADVRPERPRARVEHAAPGEAAPELGAEV